MAQMTPDASFGPVLIAAALYIAYFVAYNLYIQWTLVLIYKNKHKNKKKKHT